MNLQGKDRIFNSERDDGMSRKEKILDEQPDRLNNAEFERNADETVDISQFAAVSPQPEIQAESEEAKKIAELMESISKDDKKSDFKAASARSKRKEHGDRKKHKKEKKSSLYKETEQEDLLGEGSDITDSAYEPEIYGGVAAMPEFPPELDRDFYDDGQPEQYDGEAEIEDESGLSEEYSDDLQSDGGELDEYEESLLYEPETEEIIDYGEAYGTAEEADEDEGADSEAEIEEISEGYGDDYADDEEADGEAVSEEIISDVEEEYAPEDEAQSETEGEAADAYKPSGVRGIFKRIKDFWNGPEDFEEKFDDDFDPSVFDSAGKNALFDTGKPAVNDENDGENIEQPQEYDGGGDTDEPSDESAAKENSGEDNEEVAAENDEPENIVEGEQAAEDDEDTYGEDAEADKEEGAEEKKKTSVFARFKTFWNGDDLKVDEDVSEEDIMAEEAAEGKEWIKPSVKYDDLSDYAPKQRTQDEDTNSENIPDEDSEEIEHQSTSRKISGLLALAAEKFKALFASSVKSEEAEQADDGEYSQDAEDEGEEIDEAEESERKSSPIEQIKSIWNDEDEYIDEEEEDDEEDEELSDEEDEQPIDAQFSDGEPVVSRPVLTVLEPLRSDDEEEQENNENAEAAETEQETVFDDEGEISDDDVAESAFDVNEKTDEAEDEEKSDAADETSKADEADEEIITEGPDAPVEISSAKKTGSKPKRGLIGRLKSFWNGDAPKAEDNNEEALQLDNENAQADGAQTDNTEKEDEKADSENAEAAAAQTLDDGQDEEAATFEDISSTGFKIDEVDGRQIVNGKVIPKYTHESMVEKISLSNENLQYVVRREYEEYVRQAKYKPKASEIVAPEVNSEVSKAVKEGVADAPILRDEPEQTEKAEKSADKKQDRRSIKDVLFGGIENSADFSEFREQTSGAQQNEQSIDDYEKPSDARAIRAEINYDNRKVTFRCIALGAVFLIMLAMYVVQRYVPALLTDNIPNSDIMICLISLVLLAASAVLCHSTVLGGLKPLLAFKGNSDTAVAVAVVGCAAQGIVSFFEPQIFFSGGLHLYSILAIAALLLNNLGKLCIVRRIRDNFRFVSSPNRKYSARIYNDEEISEQMISKTNAEKPVVALQNRTRFLKGFLRFSYMPDPSERAASFTAPITTVIAVIVAIICGITGKTAANAVSAFSIVACMGIPMCSLLAVNIPMKKLCSEALKNKAMIIGYPAVKHFADTRAVMVDSRELYPRGKVQLLAVKTFNAYNIDRALLNAAAVMKIANTPMTYMFEDVISEKGEQLPAVESVKYEDGKGIVSWVSGERLLLGNRELMTKYSITLPSVDFEESSKKGRTNSITYLANAGELVAMLVTDYQADARLSTELKRLENNGVTILIRTADPNVSQIKVAKDFGIFIRSIKILPTTLGNICKDEMSRRDEASRAFIATEGRLHSLARAISGCIKIRDNISIALVIQIIAVVLGVLIAGIVAVFAGVGGLSGLDLLLYVVFWAAASVIAPMIQKA